MRTPLCRDGIGIAICPTRNRPKYDQSTMTKDSATQGNQADTDAATGSPPTPLGRVPRGDHTRRKPTSATIEASELRMSVA